MTALCWFFHCWQGCTRELRRNGAAGVADLGPGEMRVCAVGRPPVGRQPSFLFEPDPARSGPAAFEGSSGNAAAPPWGRLHPARLQDSGRIVRRPYPIVVNALLSSESQAM